MAVLRFENILDKVGNNGKWQALIFFLISINGAFVTLYNLSSVFIVFTPDHWCKIAEVDSIDAELTHNWTQDRIKKFAIPNNGFSKCEIYAKNYTNVFNNPWNENYYKDNVNATPCTDWNYSTNEFQWTLATKWNLVCQSTIFASIIKLSFMCGNLLGSLSVGFVSDKFGRRGTALLGTLLTIISGIATSFPIHYMVVVIFRTLVGAGCAITTSSFYVLLAETTSIKSRSIYQMAYLSMFSIGMMILPGIVYYVRDWTTISLIISLGSAFNLFSCWILPESPRWLILKGKLEDAESVLASMAKTNGKEVEKNILMDMISECHRNEIISDDFIEKRPTIQLFLDLFRQEMRRATLICYILCQMHQMDEFIHAPKVKGDIIFLFLRGIYWMKHWGLVTSAYYAIIFNIPSLGNTIFLTLFMSGATEFPSYVLGALLLPCFGRRTLLSGAFLIGGVLNIIYLILSQDECSPWIFTTLAFSSKFAINIGFCILYVYTTELFPTRHRHMALGTSSTSGRVGAILAPFVVDFLGSYSKGSIVMGVYGIQSIIAAVLCLLLPETKTKMLPETLEDVKHFDTLEMDSKS